MNHEVRAILRYSGAPEKHPTSASSSIEEQVVLNCFDMATPSLQDGSKCLPVTALQTHRSYQQKYKVLAAQDPDENHEVAFEHSRGSKHYGHYTRVRSNVLETDRKLSHRSLNYTQFVLPGRPTMYDDMPNMEPLDHDHTLHLDIQHGNNVQIVWNHRSRTSHPIHIHGYKFIVVATHEADVFKHCSIVDCPDEADWFCWPLDRATVDETISSGKFIVKDTAVLPAGGYLVTRFKADNPGHWIAHCHTDFHLADGMGLILREDTKTAISPDNFPTCSGPDFEAYDPGALAAHKPACNCLGDPETILHAAPEPTWKCSTDSLCRHDLVTGTHISDSISVANKQKGGERVRGVPQGRNWVKQITAILLSVVLLVVLCLVIQYVKPIIPKFSNEEDDRDLTSREQFYILGGIILRYEWKKYMKPVMILQVVGLAAVGGLIYFDAGYDTAERAFREKIALVFWSCAFWSVSKIYGSIVTYHLPDWQTMDGRMVWIEALSEPSWHPPASTPLPRRRSLVMCSVGTYHLTRFIVSLLLASPWPVLFSLVTESFAQMAPSIGATLGTGFILLMTQQAFDAMVCMLAEVAGPK